MTKLKKELEHVNWDIAEVKRGSEDRVKLLLFHYKGEMESTTGEIGLIIHRKLQRNIQSLNCISIRVMYINLRLNKRHSRKIIQVYAPTSNYEDEQC